MTIKKLMAALLFTASFMGNAEILSTGEGLIPHYFSDNGSRVYTYLYFSNVTDGILYVQVTFIDENGQAIHEPVDNPNGGNFTLLNTLAASEPSSGPTMTFNITGRGTSTVRIDKALGKHGHAVVRWFSEIPGQENNGLAVHGRVFRIYGNNENAYAIVVNDGKPF